MRLLDSHAHIGEESFDEDREAMLLRAREAGVEAIVVIGYNAPSSTRAVEIATAAPEVATPSSPAMVATAGFAPHNVQEADDEARSQVRAQLGDVRVVAVGEIGLDFHYDMPPDAQRELFDEQLRWAVQAELPVVIHSREAEHDVIEALRQAGAVDGPNSPLRGVIHCFTESLAMAQAALGLGFYISFSGILTFKTAVRLRQVAARVPLDRTLIETDSPYLAPVPHRGKRNEPAFVGAVAECLARVHGLDAEQVAEGTASNCRRLFGLC